MNKQLIGILAGMGPKSTAPFVDLVIRQCQKQFGAHYDDDFPPMMIHSKPTPFHVRGEMDHDAIKAEIITGLKQLEQNDVAFIAIPCNSAHVYYEDLAKAVSTPLLNMIEEAVAVVPEDVDAVALLATQMVLDANLYQGALQKRGIDVFQADGLQEQMNKLILEVKESEDLGNARRQWIELCTFLEDSKIDTAVIACTELNAVLGAGDCGVQIIDATRALAAATVRRWREAVAE